MFRNNRIRAMILGLPVAAVAAPDVAAPPANAAAADGPGVRILDTGRYVQTQLDWRSYYLNRLGAPRQAAHPGVSVATRSALDNGS